MEPHYDAFAVAAPGLESIVMAELKSLRATRARTVEGGVEFRASRALLYTANLHLRTAGGRGATGAGANGFGFMAIGGGVLSPR